MKSEKAEQPKPHWRVLYANYAELDDWIGRRAPKSGGLIAYQRRRTPETLQKDFVKREEAVAFVAELHGKFGDAIVTTVIHPRKPPPRLPRDQMLLGSWPMSRG